MYNIETDDVLSELNSSIKRSSQDRCSMDDISCDIQLTIPSYKKVSTTMETFIIYNIETTGSKGTFAVTRRYADFEWLNQRLIERYPMVIMPPLPQKHNVTAIERFVGEFIDQRQAALCHFLRRVLSHPIVGLDHEYWQFLTISPLAFSELKKSHPAVGKLEVLFQSLHGLTNVVGTSNGGCVDTLYKAELDKSSATTSNIGSLMRGLERVVHRSIDNWTAIGHAADKEGAAMKNWTVLSEVGQQGIDTAEAVKKSLEPWVREYGLYCGQAEKAVRRRDAIEAKYVANRTRVAQGKAVADDVCSLHDTLNRSNADLKSEFDRWQSERSAETRHWLATFADIHIEHYQRSTDIWRQFISTLHTLTDDAMY